MGRTVFHGGKVFDGSGSPPASADVVIEDARIVEVGRGLDGDDGVDCTGKALLPGLFDCHMHLAFRYEDFDEYARMQEPFSLGFYRSVQNLRTTIGLGITTVRDASGADAGLRIAVDEGTLVGPRMQVSVSMLSMTGGHNDPWLPSGTLGIFGVGYPGMPSGVCDGVDGVTRKVREMVRAGADVIKIASSGGFLSPNGRPHGAELLAGRGRCDRACGRRPRHMGDVARPRFHATGKTRGRCGQSDRQEATCVTGLPAVPHSAVSARRWLLSLHQPDIAFRLGQRDDHA